MGFQLVNDNYVYYQELKKIMKEHIQLSVYYFAIVLFLLSEVIIKPTSSKLVMVMSVTLYYQTKFSNFDILVY